MWTLRSSSESRLGSEIIWRTHLRDKANDGDDDGNALKKGNYGGISGLKIPGYLGLAQPMPQETTPTWDEDVYVHIMCMCIGWIWRCLLTIKFWFCCRKVKFKKVDSNLLISSSCRVDPDQGSPTVALARVLILPGNSSQKEEFYAKLTNLKVHIILEDIQVFL